MPVSEVGESNRLEVVSDIEAAAYIYLASVKWGRSFG
jgi:hypothetical protein